MYTPSNDIKTPFSTVLKPDSANHLPKPRTGEIVDSANAEPVGIYIAALQRIQTGGGKLIERHVGRTTCCGLVEVLTVKFLLTLLSCVHDGLLLNTWQILRGVHKGIEKVTDGTSDGIAQTPIGGVRIRRRAANPIEAHGAGNKFGVDDILKPTE